MHCINFKSSSYNCRVWNFKSILKILLVPLLCSFTFSRKSDLKKRKLGYNKNFNFFFPNNYRKGWADVIWIFLYIDWFKIEFAGKTWCVHDTQSYILCIYFSSNWLNFSKQEWFSSNHFFRETFNFILPHSSFTWARKPW